MLVSPVGYFLLQAKVINKSICAAVSLLYVKALHINRFGCSNNDDFFSLSIQFLYAL